MNAGVWLLLNPSLVGEDVLLREASAVTATRHGDLAIALATFATEELAESSDWGELNLVLL